MYLGELFAQALGCDGHLFGILQILADALKTSWLSNTVYVWELVWFLLYDLMRRQ
jgi:hypothetical protein